MAEAKENGFLSMETVNPKVIEAQYAVRGELVIKANNYKKQLEEGKTDLPFKRITFCNIGNPQQLGNPPVTFNRQVLALTTYPHLIDHELAPKLFPKDVLERARYYCNNMSGGSGAYVHSMGLEVVRKEVAAFIEKRDGFPTSPDNIFLTDGASPAVKMLLQTLVRNEKDGIMIPIPQYPLYSASITLVGGTQIHYYLNEADGWSMNREELERSYAEAVKKGISPRALCIINPGNPTGQCLSYKNMKEVVEFCCAHKLCLLADEVYQPNIYGATPFISFKRVVREMGEVTKDFQLVSFHSVSKGFVGECGRRGGYMELCGLDPEVVGQLYKLASVNLCSNVDGQLMVGLMVNPPKEGSASYEQYINERDSLLAKFKERAMKVAEFLNSLTGVTCNAVNGAMYAFPNIVLPPAAVEAAKKAGKAPDAFYCLELLAKTGLCVVPGSGFGQRNGTWHFRTTILPRTQQLQEVFGTMRVFHEDFMRKYA